MRRRDLLRLTSVTLAAASIADGSHAPLLARSIGGTQQVEIVSADPASFADILRGRRLEAPVRLAGHLLAPSPANAVPLIIILPGSGGLGPLHLRHARTLRSAGFAALAIDPYGGRGITETISDQTRLTFAASAFDALAAIRWAGRELGVAAERTGLLGFSRGGTAALLAASRVLGESVLGPGRGPAAALLAYPWCGLGFRTPDIGRTRLHILIGDADDWVSPVQCQGQVMTLSAAGARATIGFYPGAVHAFDSGATVGRIESAVKALGMPVVHIADNGHLVDWRDGSVRSDWTDRTVEQLMRDGGFVARGALAGSRDGEAQRFARDMVAFFRSVWPS